MAAAEVTRSGSPAMLPARGAEQNQSVAAMAASQSESTHDDPERLEQYMRRAAAFHDDGSLRGVRVYPGWDEQVFDEAGLEAGDLVVAVNGEPLNDPVRASDLLDSLGPRCNREDNCRARGRAGGVHAVVSVKIRMSGGVQHGNADCFGSVSGLVKGSADSGWNPPASAWRVDYADTLLLQL
ncbi:MAG: hypothetical protein IPM70_12020 [Proteobacteria bacterium]|nr:hypothetical protein [Pseudomonadota bacterium]